MRLLRLLLSAVFLFAGTTKLLDAPETFADAIASFRLLPPILVSLTALMLPALECLVGVILLINRPRRLGSFCALSLAALFLFALAAALVRGIRVDCGCFGTGRPVLPLAPLQRMWFDLARDAVLTVMALVLYRHDLAAARSLPNA